MVTNTNSAIETRHFDKDSISTVFSAGSMYITRLFLDELKDKYRAQLGIAESQYSAISGVFWGISSLKMRITEAEAVTEQTLNTDRLHLSTNQRNSLSQFLADCRSLKSFLDTFAPLRANIQNSFLPEEQKGGHELK